MSAVNLMTLDYVANAIVRIEGKLAHGVVEGDARRLYLDALGELRRARRTLEAAQQTEVLGDA